MKAAERIERIKRCAALLPQERDWGEIDFILDQFGLPISRYWSDASDNGKLDYVRTMLAQSKFDDPIRELDEFLTGHVATTPDEASWEPNTFRLFVTHVAARKTYATTLKSSLAWWGVEAFVAHEDIDPGKAWLDRIIASLHSCDALAALCQEGFVQSPWCDQEVGIALGRGVPVIPVRLDFDPYGFFGMVQAVAGTGREPSDIARDLVPIFLDDKKTNARMTGVLVEHLIRAGSFTQANALSKMIADHAQGVTHDQVRQLREAQRSNPELVGAWHVDYHLGRLEQHLGPPPAEAVTPSYNDYYDREPF